MKTKNIYSNSALLLVSIILSLFIGEFILRTIPFDTVLKEWNYEEVPVESISQLEGIELVGEHNSLGLRDKEYPLDHSTYRILAVGDSFTYGYRLKNSGSWPKIAEAALKKEGLPNIEVLNAGRPYADTSFQYQLFQKFYSRYKPDMVLISFLINDCTNLSSAEGANIIKERLDKFIEKSNDYVSHLQKYVHLSILKYRLTQATIAQYAKPYQENLETYQACQKAFLDFRDATDKENIKLVVVIYPMLYKLNKNHPFMGIHNQMMNFFHNSGIEAYDLTSAFYGYKDTDLWISSDDSHPNRKANNIAARRIVEIIKILYKES